MKRLIILFLFVSSFSSCKVLTSYYLKGSYPEQAIKVTTTQSYDSVWATIQQSLANEGIDKFKINNRESGMIISDEIEFKGELSREDKEGRLTIPDAWVVIGNFRTLGGKTLEPTSVKGFVTVRIIDTGRQREISVSLTNLKCFYVYQQGSEIEQKVDDIPVKSTGNLEKKIVARF